MPLSFSWTHFYSSQCPSCHLPITVVSCFAFFVLQIPSFNLSFADFPNYSPRNPPVGTKVCTSSSPYIFIADISFFIAYIVRSDSLCLPSPFFLTPSLPPSVSLSLSLSLSLSAYFLPLSLSLPPSLSLSVPHSLSLSLPPSLPVFLSLLLSLSLPAARSPLSPPSLSLPPSLPLSLSPTQGR